MGFEPFYILDAFTITLKKFGLWKPLDRGPGFLSFRTLQVFTDKYYIPGAIERKFW